MNHRVDERKVVLSEIIRGRMGKYLMRTSRGVDFDAEALEKAGPDVARFTITTHPDGSVKRELVMADIIGAIAEFNRLDGAYPPFKVSVPPEYFKKLIRAATRPKRR